MPDDLATALSRLCRNGVVTREELLRAGVPSTNVDRTLRRGLLERRHPGVYLLAGLPDLWIARALADVAYVSVQSRRLREPGAPRPAIGLTGTGAAALHGIPQVERPSTPVVATGHASKVRSVMTLHRPTLRHTDIVLVHGVPATDVPWTIGELAHALVPTHFTNVLADSLREEIVTFEQLHEVAARMDEDGDGLRAAMARLAPGDDLSGPAHGA